MSRRDSFDEVVEGLPGLDGLKDEDLNIASLIDWMATKKNMIWSNIRKERTLITVKLVQAYVITVFVYRIYYMQPGRNAKELVLYLPSPVCALWWLKTIKHLAPREASRHQAFFVHVASLSSAIQRRGRWSSTGKQGELGQ